MEFVLSLLVGVGLSATSGFRVFVPLLVLSVASLAGWIELAPAFAWIGTYPALVALLVATILELAAYLFPLIDNLLGAAAVPVSILAGTMITVALIGEYHPMLSWLLSILAGGGAALGGSAISNSFHAGSTATTGGTANPLLSLLESIFTVFISILVVLVPLLGFIFLVLLLYLVMRLFRKKRKSPYLTA